MRYRRLALPAAFLLVAALVLLISASANGRPTTYTTTALCGSTITSSVTLTSNLDCGTQVSNAPAITFGASGVTLNLNGHSITAKTGYDCVYANFLAGLTVTGGTLNNCAIGVDLESEDTASTVKNVTINAPTSYGVYDYEGAGNSINGVTVSNSGGTGIYFYYAGGDTVTGSKVFWGSASSQEGIEVDGSNNVVFKNNSVTNAADGFYDYYSDHDTYSGNTATNSGAYGFDLNCDSYGIVTANGNTATGSGSYGFYLFECYYSDSSSYEGGGSLAPAVMSGNTASGGDSYGFYDDYNPGAVYSGNTASGNNDTGFYFTDEEANYTITGNTAVSNNGDGFFLRDAYYDEAPAVFTKNVATKNDGYGFDSDGYGVNGSGNSAKNNTSGGQYTFAGVSGQP